MVDIARPSFTVASTVLGSDWLRPASACHLDPDGQPTLLGKAEFLQATYAEALALGTFGATELATALGITPQNANNRLKRLADAGAICRHRLQASDKGGKEFVYTTIVTLSSTDAASQPAVRTSLP
jgi:hypothetical protein